MKKLLDEMRATAQKHLNLKWRVFEMNATSALALCDAIDELVKALEFYAEANLWKPTVIIPGGVPISDIKDPGVIQLLDNHPGEQGETARQALKKWKEE